MIVTTNKAVDGILTDALAKADEAKAANYINWAYRTEERREVVLTTVIEQEPLAWIAYNAEQLDELISQLEVARAGLVKP